MNQDREIAALTEQCRYLIERVNDLREATGDRITGLARTGRKSRKLIIVTMVGLGLDILLSIALVIVGSHVSSTSDQVKDSDAAVHAIQKRTSDEVLCPLYRIFIQAEKNPPPPNLNAQQRAQRKEQFRTIHQGYNTLGCRPFIPTPPKGQAGK